MSSNLNFTVLKPIRFRANRKPFLLIISVLLYFLFAFPPLFAKAGEPIKLVFLGDSLTEGFGVDKEDAYPALTEKFFKEKGLDVKVINAGISGSTSAGGPARVKWLLKGKPDLILLALGANDGLRGLDTENLKNNLDKTVKAALKSGARVILAGMKMPLNYGEEYRKNFEETFIRVAAENKIPLIPFLLEGVAARKEFNIADGIHPNEEGHKILTRTVTAALEKIIEEIIQGKPGKS